MLLRGEEFGGRELANQIDRALTNEFNVFITENLESCLVPSTMWGHGEQLTECRQERSLAGPQACRHFDLRLPTLNTKNN